jgi:predicted ester cyclase
MANDIRALSREWFDEVWSGRNDSAMERLSSPSVLTYGLNEGGEPARGLAHFKAFRQSFLSAFPDLQVKVEDVLVDGDKSAVRLSFTGTHTGHGIGIDPTRRRVAATAIAMMVWCEGRIVEAWNEFDAAGMMRQLKAPTAKLRV